LRYQSLRSTHNIREYQDPLTGGCYYEGAEGADETKIVWYVNPSIVIPHVESTATVMISSLKTIESVLQRGEKVDNLVEDSKHVDEEQGVL